MLYRRPGIGVTYMALDVLEVAGMSTRMQPYEERRRILEALDLPEPAMCCDVFDDGEALFHVVCDRGMEGLVAKRLSSRSIAGGIATDPYRGEKSHCAGYASQRK
jgi:ATP-dependent DNA ligase